MGIMDFFKAPVQAGTPAVQQSAPVATTPGNIPNNSVVTTASTSSAGTAPNGAVPITTDTSSKAQSPLDAFSELWQTAATNGTTPAPLFNVNQESLLNAARQTDFKKAITPEQMAAIAAGGEGATQAFAEAMNSVAQHSFAQSAFATTKMIEGALKKNNETFRGEIPGMIKQHNVSDGLRTENPAFSHPAAQPIISALESQMAVKYPNATVKELRDMATQYLSSFAQAAVPAPATGTQAAGTKQPQEMDWSTFL